ncbi:DNA-binding transcriptional ArsR family regulator [Paraburkholderia sp. JPY465]|uniref:helix-turn-helix domain-containing protein n=1 Tax=Paraburkholderia sp. JPY465 TaxID=3042285 RepID=UPI003D1EFDD2
MDSLCLSSNDSLAAGDARPCSTKFDRNNTTLSGHLCNEASPTHIAETEATRSGPFGNDPNALPGKIANALVLVYEGLKEINLSENHRRVLACLIRFGVNLNDPNRSIFIKKSSIASKIGVNEATVYRGLAALEAAGIIERDDQGRKGRAVKAIATIRLTAGALARFGFFAAPRQSATESPGTDQRAPDLAPVQDVNNAPKQSSLKKQPTMGPFCKIAGKTVPSDLAWLHLKNGLSLSGMFKLMAQAKKAGTKLSNVVGHCAHSLAALSGRELFAYLSSLIAQPIDFDRTARVREEQARIRDQKRLESEQFEAQLRQLAAVRGRTFSDPRGGRWQVEEGAFVVRARDRAGSVPFTLAREAVAAITDGTWSACTGESLAMRFAGDGETVPRATNSAWTAMRDRLRRQVRA